MLEKTLKILNDEGLHARPAGVFAKKAAEFKSAVEVRFNGQTKNAKSVMALMSLGLQKDSEITLVANGEDAAAALESLSSLVNSRFQ